MGTPGKYQIFAGDFNFNLLKVNENTSATRFFNNLVSHSFAPQITLPTRKDPVHGTLTIIDNIWLRSPPSDFLSNHNISSRILTDKISDHFACVASFNVQSKSFELPKYISKRKFSGEYVTRFTEAF